MRKRFYIQIIVVAIVSMLFSTLYYYSICYGLRKTNESFPGKLNQILYDTTRYDAFFVGTSRVLKNIDPVQFDSVTGISSYNAGIDGANFGLIDMITRHFIQVHHRPRYVFINLDTYTMEKDSSLFYYPQFFPHIQCQGMDKLALIEPKLLLGKKYPFLAVSYMDDYLKGVAFHALSDTCPGCNATFRHRGFSPIGSADYYNTSDEFPLQYTCDMAGFARLDSLCDYCTKQHCTVIFIMAPIFMSTNNKQSNAHLYYSLLRGIEARYNIKEFNYYTDKRFTKNMFYNRTHLNEKGARSYTQILADSFRASQ
jgi:hypothetical protein